MLLYMLLPFLCQTILPEFLLILKKKYKKKPVQVTVWCRKQFTKKNYLKKQKQKNKNKTTIPKSLCVT